MGREGGWVQAGLVQGTTLGGSTWARRAPICQRTSKPTRHRRSAMASFWPPFRPKNGTNSNNGNQSQNAADSNKESNHTQKSADSEKPFLEDPHQLTNTGAIVKRPAWGLRSRKLLSGFPQMSFYVQDLLINPHMGMGQNDINIPFTDRATHFA